MSNTVVPGLADISIPAALPETRVTPSPRHAAANRAAWGSCEIRLVADRVASRRTGSTHKVYRGWRFEVAMHHGHPQPGTTLFTVPVDAEHLAASGSRYAMVQLANQGAKAAGGSAAFAWSASSIGTADPFAAALEQAHRRLDAGGWTQNTTVPTCYAKTNPTMHVREETVMPPSDASTQSIAISGGAVEPGTPWSGFLPLAKTSRPEAAELDGWETDGGKCSTVIECTPLLRPGETR